MAETQLANSAQFDNFWGISKKSRILLEMCQPSGLTFYHGDYWHAEAWMFDKRKKFTVFVSSAALALSALVASSPANAAPEVGGMPGQNTADTASSSMGGWSNTTSLVAGRPYVTAFSVDGVSKLTTTPSSPTDAQWSTGLRVVVTATNSCKVGQLPAAGVCAPGYARRAAAPPGR